MTEIRVSLKMKTIIALRIKDTIILITILIQFLYRKNYCKSFVNAHAAYEIDLAEEKEEKFEYIVQCELSKANKGKL